MKKLICLTLCLLFLCTVPVWAETRKSISTDSVEIACDTELNIPGTNKTLYISLSRTGMFKSLFGIVRTDTLHWLTLLLYDSKTASNADSLVFSSKTPPLFNDGLPGNQHQLRYISMSAENITFESSNYELKEMLKNKKLSIVLTTKSGTVQTIELPKETVDEWIRILKLDLLAEYKKGI